MLDFSTTKFDDFTEECVGIRLTEHYNLVRAVGIINLCGLIMQIHIQASV